MKALTGLERQKIYRAKMRRKGFRNVLVWIPPKDKARLRAYVLRLQDGR